MATGKQKPPSVISYMTMRKLVGILGIALPFVLLIGGALGRQGAQTSISAYYYTSMGTILVGILCGVSLFLFSYKGYDRWDTIATNIAAGAALGIAIFPSFSAALTHPVGPFMLKSNVSQVFHVGFATVFFVLLALISFFLFTKTDKKKIDPEKKAHNIVYRVCAIVIVAMLILIVVTMAAKRKGDPEPYLIFIFESIALIAFGTSWLVKGKAIEDGRRLVKTLLKI
jgi:hypothetical protein